MRSLRIIRDERRIQNNNLLINNNNKNETNQPSKIKFPNNCVKEFTKRGLATHLSMWCGPTSRKHKEAIQFIFIVYCCFYLFV
jgi:hypothetical protein